MKKKNIAFIIMQIIALLINTSILHAWTGDTWGTISRETVVRIADEMTDFSWTPKNRYKWLWSMIITGTVVNICVVLHDCCYFTIPLMSPPGKTIIYAIIWSLATSIIEKIKCYNGSYLTLHVTKYDSINFWHPTHQLKRWVHNSVA